MENLKGLILAAGLGTRLKPITDELPKALVKVNGKPLLYWAIEKMKSAGIENIVVNVHHFAEQIIDYIEKYNFGINIEISDERETLFDTGGAVKKLGDYFSSSPFLVHNVDVISDININNLFDIHKSNDAMATLTVSKRESSRYLLFNKDKYLCGWKNIITGEMIVSRYTNEKFEEFAFGGIQIVSPDIFQHMPEENVFSIIKLYLKLAEKYKISYYDHTGSNWFDVGKEERLSDAANFLKNK